MGRTSHSPSFWPRDVGTFGFLNYEAVKLELVGIYLRKYSILKAGAYTPIN
jgi:hypothetical protein